MGLFFVAEGLDAVGAGEECLEVGFAVGFFGACDGLIEEFVEGAKAGVALVAEGAAFDALGGCINGLEDFEDVYFAGLALEGEAAAESALAVDEVGTNHGLEDFGKVALGHLGAFGDLGGCFGGSVVLGQIDSGAEGVFTSG